VKTPTCPSCAGAAERVIFLGLPMKLCPAPDCSTLWGAWSWAAALFPISSDGTFAFMAYRDSGYLAALWHWLIGTTA